MRRWCWGGFGFPDYSEAGASELLGLMGEADLLRRRAEGYLVGLVARYGELEGPGAAATVCHQLGISAYRARRLAKTAEGLAALPEFLGAVQDGRLSADQGGMVAESHKRAPMSADDQQELLVLGGWQGHDEFKKTVVAREDQRRADDGMGRAERQRARRSAKVFDGSGGMVVLHAELDQESGERVKIAVDAMSTKMLGDDIAFDPVRTFEQRNADALVALITQQPAEAGDPDTGAGRPGLRDPPAEDGAGGVRRLRRHRGPAQKRRADRRHPHRGRRDPPPGLRRADRADDLRSRRTAPLHGKSPTSSPPKPRSWPYTAETAAVWAAASDPKPATPTTSNPGTTTGPPT